MHDLYRWNWCCGVSSQAGQVVNRSSVEPWSWNHIELTSQWNGRVWTPLKHTCSCSHEPNRKHWWRPTKTRKIRPQNRVFSPYRSWKSSNHKNPPQKQKARLRIARHKQSSNWLRRVHRRWNRKHSKPGSSLCWQTIEKTIKRNICTKSKRSD